MKGEGLILVLILIALVSVIFIATSLLLDYLLVQEKNSISIHSINNISIECGTKKIVAMYIYSENKTCDFAVYDCWIKDTNIKFKDYQRIRCVGGLVK